MTSLSLLKTAKRLLSKKELKNTFVLNDLERASEIVDVRMGDADKARTMTQSQVDPIGPCRREFNMAQCEGGIITNGERTFCITESRRRGGAWRTVQRGDRQLTVMCHVYEARHLVCSFDLDKLLWGPYKTSLNDNETTIQVPKWYTVEGSFVEERCNPPTNWVHLLNTSIPTGRDYCVVSRPVTLPYFTTSEWSCRKFASKAS